MGNCTSRVPSSVVLNACASQEQIGIVVPGEVAASAVAPSHPVGQSGDAPRRVSPDQPIERRGRLHASLRGPAAGLGVRGSAAADSLPQSPEQMIATWSTWANARHAPSSERRAEAARRVIACIKGEAENPTSLDLSKLGLKGVLPPVPGHLTHLDVSRNQDLTGVACIPESVIEFKAHRCGLRHLPPFPQNSRLQRLCVNANPGLQTLPLLPRSLIELKAEHCGLRQLPSFEEGSQLQELHINLNRLLHTLPAIPRSVTKLVANNCGLRYLPPFPPGSQLDLFLVQVTCPRLAVPS